jgi:predicted RNase H-like nuclease
VAGGRLQGITLTPTDPVLFKTLIEVLDYRPSYEVIALACPVGLLDEPRQGGRTCDREARKIVGFPRSGAIFSAPARSALDATTYEEAVKLNDGMSIAAYSQLRYAAEVDSNLEPYWQRTVFEAHPEMSFYQLNGDTPMYHGKHTHRGQDERRALLERRVIGIEQIISVRVRGVKRHHLYDAAAVLWTARRIAGRVVNRLPDDPEWDGKGLRMEIVR